jgi:hypothetical protein
MRPTNPAVAARPKLIGSHQVIFDFRELPTIRLNQVRERIYAEDCVTKFLTQLVAWSSRRGNPRRPQNVFPPPAETVRAPQPRCLRWRFWQAAVRLAVVARNAFRRHPESLIKPRSSSGPRSHWRQAPSGDDNVSGLPYIFTQQKSECWEHRRMHGRVPIAPLFSVLVHSL